MNKRLQIVLLAAAVLAGILFFFRGKGAPSAAAAGFQRPPAPVSVAGAITRDMPVYLDAIGKCVAREMVAIQPQVSGRITRIHFVDGADVQTGDTLFTIDPRPYRASLKAAEADFEQSKSGWELAKVQLERSTQLLNSKNISQSEFDVAQNNANTAEAQMKRSEAALENARLNLEYCFIRSPISGRAGRRLSDIGNVVTPASGPLLTIQRMDPIYADFVVNENQLPDVQANMSHGALQVEVSLPDHPDSVQKGTLTFLDNAIQAGTGTVNLRATVANGNHRLWPGQFVNVRLVLRTIHNATIIPSSATQMSAKGQFVYVVKTDSTAEMRPVVLGQLQGDLVVVDSGLQPGDNVIINGQMAVAPGAKVRIAESHVTGETAKPAKGA